MTSEQETLRLVGEWLEEGRTALPDHVLDAVLEQLPTKPQRRPWPARRVPNVTPIARYAIAAAAVVAVAIVGVNVARAPGPGGPPSLASPSPSVAASPTPSPPGPLASLPALRLPGARAGPAGEYGWEGGPGDRAGMHKVTEAAGGEVTALIFSVGPDCLAEGGGQEAVPVRVADLHGVSIEPYEPPVTFNPGEDAVTRAHALAVGDRTLCVFLTWHPTTTGEDLAAAEDVLDTLRAAPVGEDRIRITFTLDRGWDTG